MRFLGFGSKKEEDISVSEDYTPFINVDEAEVALANADKLDKIKPNFKGEVEQKEIKWPVELGEEHPFDFKTTEGLYEKFGFVTGVVDKFVDFVVGPGFYVTCEDEDAQKICEDFMQDVNLDTVLRAWVKEALIKNGFLELGGKKGETPKGLKVLDAKYMYVKRDKLGVVEGYNQYTGGFKRLDKSKIIPFEPHQIAHLAFNRIGDRPYGMGIVAPALVTINNLLQNEKDLHVMMHRKANSPYHVKMGGVFGGKYYKPKSTDVDAFGKKLEWLHNKHEWVTDGLTDMKVLDFGNIGEKFNEVLDYDIQMLFYTFQVPAVLMGQAKVPEGLAKVQMDAFERRVQSIQAEVEKVIEKHIFRRLLQANGLDVHVEFEWGRPSSMETYERLKAITELVKIPTASSALIELLEKQIVQLLNLPEEEYDALKQTEEEERKREEERPQPLVPGQNQKPPKFVPKKEEPKESYIKSVDKNMLQRIDKEEIEKDICPHCLDITESGKYNDINEWLGFNYKDYVAQILTFVEADGFDMVKAQTVIETAAGKLSETQIKELKKVLAVGFKKGQSIRDMAEAVDKKVKPKDLYRMKDGAIIKKDGIPVLSRSAGARSTSIVRSEVTRCANAGAIKHFKEGGVKGVRWIASYGTRTCPECADLNNKIFPIDELPPLPLHANCRCMTAPVRDIMPLPKEEVSWKPTMTESDARSFTKGSVVKGPLYHGTKDGFVESIKKDGFKLKANSDGVWITTNKNVASGYADSSKSTLKAAVNAKKMANPELMDRRGMTTSEFGNKIKEQGYDGYSYLRGPKGISTHVIFDPKNVVVIEE